MVDHGKIFDSLAACMSFEKDIPFEQARSIVEWLDLEAVLDYEILEETYNEPRPTPERVLQAVND